MKITKLDHNTWHFYITSGDGEEYPGCRLHIAFMRRSITIPLPAIIKPESHKVIAESWDAATVERMGRNWYWNYMERCYGCYLFGNHFYVYLGRHTHDSATTQSWSCFLPWNEMRHVRFSLYGLSGEHFWTQLAKDKVRGVHNYDAQHEMEKIVPTARFKFNDYDGQEIEVATHIQEREWLRGDKWCKWLSWFFSPLVRRSLDLEFSKEVGPRKGSWKGGTMGHSIAMLPGELHSAAFIRYCDQHNLSNAMRL